MLPVHASGIATTEPNPIQSIALGHLPAGWYFLEADGKRTPFILLPH